METTDLGKGCRKLTAGEVFLLVNRDELTKEQEATNLALPEELQFKAARVKEVCLPESVPISEWVELPENDLSQSCLS